MEAHDESQATQPATQTALDPRRIGQQNSGFSDHDISDIICLLYPNSEPATREVQAIAESPEYGRHTAGRYNADAIESDLYHEDDAREFGRTRGLGDHAIVLRLSSPLKDPRLGFTFGRNRNRCDICFASDPGKRLSNIHFRIYVNHHGSVMLEDQSTNGTVVDGKLLRKRPSAPGSAPPNPPRRTLESGSAIKIIMHENKSDLVFLVRIPRRDDHDDVYQQNLASYLRRAAGEDVNKTIGPGPSGHVNLFPPKKRNGHETTAAAATTTTTTTTTPTPPPLHGLQGSLNRLPREWRGGERYARVGVIGKGAFATVHKVTSKYDGSPYAAKELDKRKFIKNGVLDQKVENEMKIMQRVHHPHIVQYIEHFDWDVHQFIIIMEYVPGGDLGKFVQENGRIAELHVRTIAEQLVGALGYLHDNKITHRDVKPDNILIHSTDPLVVKLTDFGLSKMIDTEQTFLKTFCGTLLYCAPEVYTEYSTYDDSGRRTQRRARQPVDRERYDHAVDIWSLGGVLFYTLAGTPPFPVKNGISYTELLDHIIKTPLNTSPLVKCNISKQGIHFMTRMIHVRPETRATISELQSHPWLAIDSSSIDQQFDDEHQQLSQLTLDDRQSQPDVTGTSSLREPEPDFSVDFESEKENQALFGRGQGPRLFGEVSAIGSSGAIPEGRLNLPISDSKFDETADEIRDSFEESDDFSTPRGTTRQDQNLVSVIRRPSREDNSRSALLGIGSQSLGGASSILENLNMKSLHNFESNQSRVSDLNSSKRKPGYDTSDEYDKPRSDGKPSMKRLKSGEYVDIEENEYGLFASIPALAKRDTGRQIDYPLPKTTFWDSSDRRTWHLDYPEMTHLQYNAFELAAESRKEAFEPGTPLWRLAMRHFPPARGSAAESSKPRKPRPSAAESSEWEMPPTAPQDSASNSDDSGWFPVSLAPSVGRLLHPARAEVGCFRSVPGSLVAGITVPLQDALLSWGRERTNTAVYPSALEAKVPKNAFRVVLWREGYTASMQEFRPWDPTRSSRTARASPEPDSYGFYIATKATNGIRVNGNPLPAHQPKDGAAACRYWMKLYHGDHIVFWGGEEPQNQARLVFECYWGGSSVPRPPDDPPTVVPALTGQKLDRLWPRALATLQHFRIKEEAQQDQEVRMRNMPREEERSRLFEQKRTEAIRLLAQRRSSPVSSGVEPENSCLPLRGSQPIDHRFPNWN